MAHRALVRQVSANVTLATRSMASSSSNNKRPRDDNGTAAVADLKKPKVTHPFFSPSKAGLDSSAPSPWQRCPDSLLHYIHATTSTDTASTPLKAAFFDLDGTLIATKSGAKFPKGADDWKWWSPAVKPKLLSLFDEGWEIVLISNQNGLLSPSTRKPTARHTAWQGKIAAIARSLPGMPFHLIAALGKDHYRKPMLGMYDYYVSAVAAGRPIDLSQSFYVGDAAGRPSDHGDSDRKWAENIGIAFHTPEIYFAGSTAPLSPLKGFRPRDLALAPLFTPTSTPLVPPLSITPSELILFVGSPGSGKSHFFRTYLANPPVGGAYARVNQDELGSRDKCIAVVEKLLKEKGGNRRIVIDNTNRDRNVRAIWIELAKKYSVPIRCFFFPPNPLLAKHNNLYRLYPTSDGAYVPPVALSSFEKALEEPEIGEGFAEEPKRIGFVGWTESRANGAEEDGKRVVMVRERWEGWMS